VTATPPSAWASPTLAAGRAGSPPAYEQKYRMTVAQALEAEEWAAARLAPDPGPGPAARGRYAVTTVYLDTPDRAVYHRLPAAGPHKYRVRQYGADGPAFLERKSKEGGRVWKERAAVGADDLRADLPPGWFADAVAAGRLAPVCRVTYARTAFVGPGPVRLTFDRAAVAGPADDLALVAAQGVGLFAADEVVCELKFVTALPPLFREFLEAFGPAPAVGSKYRRAVAATGRG